ncbi:hypothetical protein T439DRAFT_66003, partial [Meredithblackwellia eburnea MCA 4105]
AKTRRLGDRGAVPNLALLVNDKTALFSSFASLNNSPKHPSRTRMKNLYCLAVLFAITIRVTQAFYAIPGNACGCCRVGDVCDYGPAGKAGVTFHCGPSGFVGDDGALCTTDDACYNYCGSNGRCGGVGAHCNSDIASGHGLGPVTCDTTINTHCNVSAGTCFCAAATQAAAAKQVPVAGRIPLSKKYHH